MLDFVFADVDSAAGQCCKTRHYNPSLGRCWAAESADVEPAWNQHRANDAKEGMIPSLGRCWADESADHELMWDQRWAYYGKQGINPSLGRYWADEFADVEPASGQ